MGRVDESGTDLVKHRDRGVAVPYLPDTSGTNWGCLDRGWSCLEIYASTFICTPQSNCQIQRLAGQFIFDRSFLLQV